MNIHEAIKTLDGVIPSSDNKMVDFEQMGYFEHFFIAIAWEAVKTEIERLKKEVDYWGFEAKVARKYIAEVRKETAKEIVERLRKYDSYFDDYKFDSLLDDIELDYGVEVEE